MLKELWLPRGGEVSLWAAAEGPKALNTGRQAAAAAADRYVPCNEGEAKLLTRQRGKEQQNLVLSLQVGGFDSGKAGYKSIREVE